MFVLLGSEWPIGILYRLHTCYVYWQASNVVLMSGRRRRRRTNIEQHWVIVGHVSYTVLSGWYCCASEAG